MLMNVTPPPETQINRGLLFLLLELKLTQVLVWMLVNLTPPPETQIGRGLSLLLSELKLTQVLVLVGSF